MLSIFESILYVVCDKHLLSEHLKCDKNNEVLIGGCASGRNPDCQGCGLNCGSIYHSIKCCPTDLTNLEKNCKWNYGNTYLECGKNQVARGQCVSGGNRDCLNQSNGKKYVTAIFCCDKIPRKLILKRIEK